MRAVAGVYLALLAGKSVAALRGALRAPAARSPEPAELSRVVVAQPVLSGDPGLEQALADNQRALAGARLCWLVDTDDAEAQDICRRLGPESVVLCEPAPPGLNPKLWKLRVALDALADDDVLVVLDDDTRLPVTSLGALLDALAAGASVATGLPGYLPARGVWGQLVEQFVDNNAALTYLPMRPVTLNGMTWAMRAGELRRLGGLDPVLHALTDDLAVAGLVLDHGGRIAQTASPQWVATEVASGAQYVRLMHRWMLFADLLLRRQPVPTAAAVALLHGTPPLLLAATLAGARRSPAAVATVLVARSLTLVALQRRIHGRVVHRPLLSVVAELLQPLHLVHAQVQRTITWRTRRYLVRSDTDFEPVR